MPFATATERNQEIARLLSRVQLGDRQGFAALCRLTSAHLFGVVLRINRNRAQAEEVLQEVYVKVWRSAQGYDARLRQPLTWLTSIARNGAIDSLRRHQADPATVSTTRDDPDDAEGHDMLDALAVAGLSADGRALVLRPLGPVQLAAGRALELWAVPDSGAPRSLGLVSPRQGVTVLQPRLLQGTAALAVSLEPAGGSPTGAPTGPIVSLGRLKL